MIGIFIFYILALASSIAGMELASTLILFAVIIALVQKKGNLPKNVLPKSVFYSALALTITAIISGLLNPDYSPSELRYIAGGQRWLLLLYFIPIGLLMVKPAWEKGFTFLVGLTFFFAVYSIIQSFTGIDIVRSTPFEPDGTRGLGLWRAKGFFSNTMTYSYTFGFLMSLLTGVALFFRPASNRFRMFIYGTTSLLGVSLFFTWTRGIWLALAAGIIVALFYRSKKTAVIAMATGLTLAGILFFTNSAVNQQAQQIVDTKYESNSVRLSIWKAYWHMYLDAPIIGRGYRLQSRYLPEYYKKLEINSDFVSHAHNNILQFLAGTGTLGALFFIAFSFSCLIYAHKLFYRIPKENELHRGWIVGVIAALVTFHVGGMTEANFVDAEVRHMLVFTLSTLFAIGTIYPEYSRENTVEIS